MDALSSPPPIIQPAPAPATLPPLVPTVTLPTTSLADTAAFVADTYDQLSYYDLYGTDVLLFFFATLAALGAYTYCQVMQTRGAIADDWVNQRCNPKYIPFAGLITRPEGKTAFEYTGENFQYCVQNILTGVTGVALQPLQYMVGSLTGAATGMAGSLNQARNFTSVLRDNIQHFTEEVLSRVLNVVAPIQRIFIAFKDTLQKSQAVMTSGLYTMMGSYLALQSLMGAILELIIKMLVALVAVIVGLWIIPVTWPAAASMSAVFLAIAIPMAIIVAFMTQVLHIKSSAIPKLRCFDENTPISIFADTAAASSRSTLLSVPIRNVRAGDVLANGDHVTAVVKVMAEGLDMVQIGNVVVSGNHRVQLVGRSSRHASGIWIRARRHPHARPLPRYEKPFVYCINTTSKQIECDGRVWADWDDLQGDAFKKVLQVAGQYAETPFGMPVPPRLIHTYLDGGYEKNTLIQMQAQAQAQAADAPPQQTTSSPSTKEVPIQEVQMGERTSLGAMVYGLVQISPTNLRRNMGRPILSSSSPPSSPSSPSSPAPLYHLLTTDGHFVLANGKHVADYNELIDRWI